MSIGFFLWKMHKKSLINSGGITTDSGHIVPLEIGPNVDLPFFVDLPKNVDLPSKSRDGSKSPQTSLVSWQKLKIQ